jgi:hypothetical protein
LTSGSFRNGKRSHESNSFNQDDAPQCHETNNRQLMIIESLTFMRVIFGLMTLRRGKEKNENGVELDFLIG